MSIPTEILLVLMAFLLATIVLGISLVIVISVKIMRPFDQELIASRSVRFSAFAIDFVIISLLSEILVMVLLPFGSYSMLLYSLFSSFFLTAPIMFISSFFNYIFFFFGPLVNWQYLVLFSYNPYSILTVFGPVFVVFIGFLYFVLLESVLKGRTIGKLILRIRTISSNDSNPITMKEAVINAFGKSFFLLWDLLIGFSQRKSSAINESRNVIRLTQNKANVIVVNTRYTGTLDDTEQVDRWLFDSKLQDEEGENFG